MLAAESTKADAESTASVDFLPVSPHEAKATVKANPKKPNLNAFFILLKLKVISKSCYLRLNTGKLKR
ncbi:hypothetical protein D3C86_1978950 [compost metagenome]